MATTFTPQSPMYYATLFGVQPKIISEALAKGVSITSTSQALNILKHGTIVKAIPLKGQAISLAKQGTLGPASKAAICQNLEGVLIFAAGLSMSPSPIDTSAMSPGQKAAVTKVLNVMNKNGPIALGPPPKAGKSSWPGLPSASASVPVAAQITDLSSATGLLMPVKGSSSNSVYYVVALLKGAAVAIRRTSHKLSIRLEGASLSKYKDVLSMMGFSDKGSHLSVHYDVPSDQSHLLSKTVGAVVGAVGFDHVNGVADPQKVPVAS